MATTQPQQPSINLAAEQEGAALVTTDGAGGIFITGEGYDPSTLSIDGAGVFSVDFLTPKSSAPFALATAQAPVAAGTGFASVVPTANGITVTVRDAAGALEDLAATITATQILLS